MSKVFEFNYKYIKDHSSSGSWRRGYEYYKKDMLLETSPIKNFYKGKVKGNFQDFYTTDLILDFVILDLVMKKVMLKEVLKLLEEKLLLIRMYLAHLMKLMPIY